MRVVRVGQNLSQDELAKRCGVHRTYITEIENGQRNISLLTLERIALALDVVAWQLLRCEELGE